MFSPKYTITNNVLINIGKIEAAKEVIENAALVPAWEAAFQREAEIRIVHYGTHIEGNPLNLAETREVLDGRAIAAHERDIQEVINLRNVLRYVDELKQSQDITHITEEIFLKVHAMVVDKIIPKSQAGSYREQQAVVKNFNTGEVTFVAPSADQVLPMVNQFLTWLTAATEIHPVVKAGIIQFEVTQIHPFTEGNGRTARAVATLSLFLDGYDIKRFFSLEEYFDKTAQDYYQTLQAVSRQTVDSESERDLTPWLEYFTEGLAKELEKIKERVKHMSIDAKLKGKMGQLQLSERQAKLVEYMQDYNSVNNGQWRTLLPNVSDDTILRDLHDLIKKKIVKKKGKTKAAVYVLRTDVL